MLYKNYSDGGIEITLEGAVEVEATRAAFEEHAAHMIALGNGSSVSDYQRAAILQWDGDDERSYRAGSTSQLIDRLTYFHEVTEWRVDELLDEPDNPDRISDSARRYELGAQALSLVEVIEARKAAIDAEWDDTI